jgi:hypothetical protein
MKNLLNKLTSFWKTGKNGKLITIIVAVLLLICVCCSATLLWGSILGSSPTYQSTATAGAAITQTFEALPTNTSIPSNTPLPSNTPRPSNTPIPSKTPTPAPQPIILNGSGDSVVDVPKWNGPAILDIKYTGSHNFVIWNYASNGEQIDLLVNTIGAYQGKRPIDFQSGENTVRLEIKASGSWEIQVLPLGSITAVAIPGTYNGTGDDVIALVGGTPDLLITDASMASSNFIIRSYGNYVDLLINEIAPYNGTVILSSDTVVLEIIATGPWSIEIKTK